MNQNIIVSAQACGYGPVSKLVTILNHLHSNHLTFIGRGVALEYIKRYSNIFDKIVLSDDNQTTISEIENCDFGIIVMNHEVAFLLFKKRRPFYFIDSLFSFWISLKSCAEMIEISKRMKKCHDEKILDDIFNSLSIHEQKILCHLLANKSYIQNFPGVPERVNEFKKNGICNMIITSSIVNIKNISTNCNIIESLSDQFILINLGGVTNFLINENNYNYYTKLIEKFSCDYLKNTKGRDIVLCSGIYKKQSILNIGNNKIFKLSLTSELFLRLMQQADIYLTSPGLTSINEVVILNKLPILLPEQHYSQYHNIYGLCNTQIYSKLSLGLNQLFEKYEIPNHDYKGSIAILRYIENVINDKRIYSAFYTKLSALINKLSLISSKEQYSMIHELRKLLTGADIEVEIRKIVQ